MDERMSVPSDNWEYETSQILDVTSDAAVELVAGRYRKPGLITPLGLPSIDQAFYDFGDRRGVPQGTYMIIGGASNVGKTQMGLHVARQAERSGQRAMIISLDMKPRDVVQRLQKAIVGEAVPHDAWSPSKWTDDHEETLKRELRRHRLREVSPEAGIAVHEAIWPELDRVEWMIRQAAETTPWPTTVVVVDHLQKIVVPGVSDVYARAETVSNKLDQLADQLDITIVGLSQLNRQASRERDRTPTMFDLWGGTSMESNAAVVIMLDHSLYERDREKHHIGRTWMSLDKNQMGPKNFRVPVLWDHAALTLREGLEDEMSEWPNRELKRKSR